MKYSIFRFFVMLAFSFAATVAAAGAWRLDPLGWTEDGSALESRSPGFALADAAPAGEDRILKVMLRLSGFLTDSACRI